MSPVTDGGGVVSRVLTELSGGATPREIADRLDEDLVLVTSVLDHAVRLGLIDDTTTVSGGCASCGPVSRACQWCPVGGVGSHREHAGRAEASSPTATPEGTVEG